MPSNSDVRQRWSAFQAQISSGAARRDPRVVARAALGLLLLLNLAAALVLFKPWGGSATDLLVEQERLRQQLVRARRALAASQEVLAKVEKARAEGDRFLGDYVLDARSAYSTVIGELDAAAEKAKVTIKESQLSVEPIEGSDTLGMMTISANYEGEYPNLTQFINLIDRSPKFLILDTIQAAPQASGTAINVNLKLNAFVRAEEGEAP